MLGGELQVAKRKLRKAVTLASSTSLESTYDRRATDLLRNAQVAPAIVDDPLEPGAKLVVLRSLRDDPLAAMHNAKQIDQAQFIAGRHWQRAYELSEIGGVKAIDPSKDAVDGGGIAQATITDSQIKAFHDLFKAMTALGLEGESLVRDVLALHLTVALAADKRGLYSELERKYLGRRFRECLDTLAGTFGYATTKLSTTSSYVA
jgi:hypothetical protein